MIKRHPDLPDHFLPLERRESFGDYASAYGDALARHIEHHGIVVVPFMPIDFDLAFFQGLTFPREWKKIGTFNGIEAPVRDGEHPLVQLGRGADWAARAQSEIARFNTQLREGLRVLFPRYRSLTEANITWRLTETVEEGMHLDVFAGGAPTPPEAKRAHRVKIFVNIDAEPRVWRTSLDLPGVLTGCADALPIELADDVNVVNDVIDKFGVLDKLPYHELAFPTMAAVISNAEVVAHEVMYGRRVVGGEFLCDAADMLDPGMLVHRQLRSWLEAGEYMVSPDPAAVAGRYTDMKGSYARTREALAKRAADARR